MPSTACSSATDVSRAISWKAKVTKPMRLSFKFTAIVEQDRISGEARYMLGTAAFSGTRA
jgi:hypothetical protein